MDYDEEEEEEEEDDDDDDEKSLGHGNMEGRNTTSVHRHQHLDTLFRCDKGKKISGMKVFGNLPD